jgi:elongation factor P
LIEGAAGLAPPLRARPHSIHPNPAASPGNPMKVPVNSIRAGNVIEYNGKLWVASKVQHISPGKGGAFVAIEAKALREGNKLQERFRSGETIDRVHIDERDCTYLFKDDNGYTFMDKETFEQLTVGADVLDEDQARFLQDGMEVVVSLYEGTPVGAELPKTVVLAVTEADAVVKGQTASSSYKPAIVEGGVRVMVPPHIGVGTRLVINTEDGSYMERAKD